MRKIYDFLTFAANGFPLSGDVMDGLQNQLLRVEKGLARFAGHKTILYEVVSAGTLTDLIIAYNDEIYILTGASVAAYDRNTFWVSFNNASESALHCDDSTNDIAIETTITVTATNPGSGVELNTFTEVVVEDILTNIEDASFAKGMIMNHYLDGGANPIPSGWQACDGTNGTPDLRNRFVVGAGITYAEGDTGGTTTETLTESQIPSHVHNVSLQTSDDGSHDHDIWWNENIGTDNSSGFDWDAGAGNFGTNTYAVDPNGVHHHTISGNSDATGGGGSHNNLPPYYGLVFIMKL